MIIAIGMMLLCIMLGGFMIRSCMGKTNSSSEAKQAISARTIGVSSPGKSY